MITPELTTAAISDPRTRAAGEPCHEVIVGPLQILALEHVWAYGESTVEQVVAAVNGLLTANGKRKLAYTTLLTVMRNLARRQLLTQRSRAGYRSHVFAAAVTQREYRARLSRYIVKHYYKDNLTAFNSAACDSVA